MRDRYEIWRYSDSSAKWVRYIYPNASEAGERYAYLLKKGKTVRPPQPVNRGLPLADRVSSMMRQLFKRSATRKRRGKLNA